MTREVLQKVRAVVCEGWCRDALAKDARGKSSNQYGFWETVKDKKTGVETTTYHEATHWSLMGAIMKATNCFLLLNEEAVAVIKVLEPLLKVRGYSYLADYNDYQLIVRKKVVAQTTQEDVLSLLDQAIVLS